MTETRVKYFCDICKQEAKEADLKRLKLPFITECDWTEGKPCAAHVEMEDVEICNKCLIKATNLYCGFQGSSKHLKENTEQVDNRLVEVVRCRDCKYFYICSYRPHGDWFCAAGEREDE